MTVIDTLVEKIRRANHQYWVENNPEISDAEYDRLVENLRKLDPKNPILLEIGQPKIVGEKIKLVKPLLSLGKTYTRDELFAWMKKVARSEQEVFMCSPKYDGCTCCQQGDVVVGRGDGYEGQSMTHLARQITSISKFTWNEESGLFEHDRYGLSALLDHADVNDYMVGELVISEQKFAELKEKYPGVFLNYKNCRNFISGFSNSKSDSVIANLQDDRGYPVYVGEFVAHRAYEVPVTLKEFENPRTLERLERILRDFQGYPTDGLVFRLRDEDYANSLGSTAHHPRGAIALKWTAMQLPAVIKKIDWDIGNERLTPVAVLEEPCLFPGHTVNRATLHCGKWMLDHNAGPGAKVVVEYAGGVIPKVVRVEHDENVKLEMPKSCPFCGALLELYDSYLICTGDECPGKATNKILHGLEVFGLKGVGPVLASKAISELYLTNIMVWMRELGSRSQANIDLLRKKGFTDHEILVLTRCAETTEAGVTPVQLLMSICIPKCGREFAETIEHKCGGILRLINFAAVDDMYNEIVGKCNLDAVTNFMVWMENHREEFVDYVSMFKIIHPEAVAATNGVVCFTGSGPRPRKQLEKDAVAMGYRPTENISEATILVCEDPNGSSSKLKKARAKGTTIMSYEEFFK